MDYEEALAYMQGLRRHGIKLGNQRIEALLDRLGNPHRAYDVVHVAGTKGKGSTTVMAAAILQAHGLKVGGYYSPYVYDVSERVQVDATPIPHADLARLISRVRPHIEALAGTPLGQTTEFELKTAVGFTYFAEREVHCAAVEVGIGGRLDATNVVTPLVSVITNIGLDHTQMLGETHAQIASEKAGIIKPGVPVVTAADVPDALRVIEATARSLDAPLARVVPESCGRCRAPGYVTWWPAGDAFAVATPERCYDGLRLRLGGEYQRINAACAIAAVEHVARARRFTVDVEGVRCGLAQAWLPGRLQVVGERPVVVLDGAHNALAARALAAEVERMPHARLLVVAGMVAGHDPDEVLRELAPRAWKVFATRPTWTRGQPAERIAAAASLHCDRVEVREPPIEAARAALREADSGDLVLITGSFYTVGDVPPSDLGHGGG